MGGADKRGKFHRHVGICSMSRIVSPLSQKSQRLIWFCSLIFLRPQGKLLRQATFLVGEKENAVSQRISFGCIVSGMVTPIMWLCKLKARFTYQSNTQKAWSARGRTVNEGLVILSIFLWCDDLPLLNRGSTVLRGHIATMARKVLHSRIKDQFCSWVLPRLAPDHAIHSTSHRVPCLPYNCLKPRFTSLTP